MAKGNPCWWELKHPGFAGDLPCVGDDSADEWRARRRQRRRRALLVVALIVLVAAWACGLRWALSQTSHDRHHASYQSWVNRDGKGRCDGRDCGEIADSDVDESGTVTRVRIEGEWCPVLPQHYLKSGNAPNWDSAHVCVTPRVQWSGKSACERFICFQPRPKG